MQPAECQPPFTGTTLKYCRCEEACDDNGSGREVGRGGISLPRVPDTPPPGSCLDINGAPRRKVVKFLQPEDQTLQGYFQPRASSGRYETTHTHQFPDETSPQSEPYDYHWRYRAVVHVEPLAKQTSNEFAVHTGVGAAPMEADYPFRSGSQTDEHIFSQPTADTYQYRSCEERPLRREDEQPQLGFLHHAEDRLKSVSRFRLSEFQGDWRSRGVSGLNMEYNNSCDQKPQAESTRLSQDSYSPLSRSVTAEDPAPLFGSRDGSAYRPCYAGHHSNQADTCASTTTTGDESTASALSSDSSGSLQAADTVQSEPAAVQAPVGTHRRFQVQPARLRRADQDRRVEMHAAEISRELALLQRRQVTLSCKSAVPLSTYKRPEARNRLSFN
ncbi:hypothetical protein CSUI_002011 [Cystoisospora suis]|uniref:Uncharacterized protein n=1 Tax=Cystoisospora suis TaxID=483139 RepID=A0A2C6KVE1_9APIC|nr:hypothetical protein CSUI_002011 [Cystoisospora suis]